MIIFLILFSALTSFAQSQFDLSAGVQGRSRPTIGAEAYVDSGLNKVFWGEKNEPKDFLYGLIRPSLGVSTSAVINSAKAEIEIFPISFLGFSVGRQYMNSNFEFPFFECKEVTCTGEFQRNYVEMKMALGLKGWILVGNYKVDTMTSPNDDEPMADWRNVIVGNPGEEVQIDRKLLFGKIFGNKLVGVLAEYTQFLGSREFKESYAAVYQFKKNNTAYMFGAGSFYSSQQPTSLILYFRINHQYFPSLKLF
jgi:hypothetical protein